MRMLTHNHTRSLGYTHTEAVFLSHELTLMRSLFFKLSPLSISPISFPACNSALGMENGGIPDSSITASSARQNVKDFLPQFGRLNNPDIAWCADLRQSSEWLKIDLARKMIVTKIATQGRPDYGSSWVKSYKISFSQDDHAWEVYKEHGVEKVNGILYSKVF